MIVDGEMQPDILKQFQWFSPNNAHKYEHVLDESADLILEKKYPCGVFQGYLLKGVRLMHILFPRLMHPLFCKMCQCIDIVVYRYLTVSYFTAETKPSYLKARHS